MDEFQMLNSNATDVFGQTLGGGTSKSSKYIQQADCICPECNQATAACRFAPHLEKCMGMGRNSFRKARTRLAASFNPTSSSASVNHYGSNKTSSNASRPAIRHDAAKSSWSDADEEEVDDDDDDWFSAKKKGHKKRLVLRSVKKKINKNTTPLKKKPVNIMLQSILDIGDTKTLGVP